MPRTGFKNTPTLAIELDGDLSTHLPGDTLTGFVTVEKPPSQQPIYNSQVRLKLFGRIKTKYKVKRKNGTSITRGRAVLFDQSYVMSTSKTCQIGEHAWPFSITIPESSQPGFARRGDEFTPEPSQGYLHTRGEDKKEIEVTKHTLPSVLYYFSESFMSGKTVEAYIEYVLVATYGESTAYHPIYLRRQSVANPITNYKMRTQTQPNVVKSLKLLPEHADTKLTFGQKSSRFFRPSKTPKYSYTVKVEYPQVIQLEHPDPIPFKIHIIPDLDPQKTTICPDNDTRTLPPVNVVSVEMKLHGDFGIRTPGSLWDTDTIKNHTFPFTFPTQIKLVVVPVIQPASKEAGMNHVTSAPEHPSAPPEPQLPPPPVPGLASFVSDASIAISDTPAPLSHAASAPLPKTLIQSQSTSPLNLGAQLSILLGCSAASTCSQRAVSFKRQVYPTFGTYNIVLKYRLEWKIKMICADEKHNVWGNYPVVVMAPSEEQESQRKRELGTQGMRKNYDDLEQGFGVVIQIIGGILQAVT